MSFLITKNKIPFYIFFITLVVYLIAIEINVGRYDDYLRKDPNTTHLSLIYGDEPFYLAVTSTIFYNHSLYVDYHFLGPDIDPHINKDKWPTMFRDPGTWRALQQPNGHYISLESPGVPWLLIPGYVLGGITGAMITMAISVSFTSVFMYKFIIKLTTPKISFISTLIFSLATLLFTYSNEIYPDVLITLFLISSLYFILKKNNSKYYISYAGALVGFGIFLKLTFLALDFFFIPLVIVMLMKKKITLGNTLLFLGFFCILSLFVVFYNDYVWHSWTGAGNISAIALLKAGGAVGVDEKPYYPIFFVESFFGKDHSIFIFSPIVMLFVLGIGILYSKDKVLLLSILGCSAILLGAYMFVNAIFMIGDDPPFRYQLPILPLLSIPFALGFQRFSRTLIYKILTFPLLAVSIAFCISFAYNRFLSLDHFPNKIILIHYIYQGLETIFPVMGPSVLDGRQFPHHTLDLGNTVFLVTMMILLIIGTIISFKFHTALQKTNSENQKA